MDAKRLKVANVWTSKSLLQFTRYFFKQRQLRKFIISDHHEQIADKLEKVISGEIKRLIINIAPRYGKTELGVKNFIAYCLSQNPRARFIHLSYSDDLALDNSEEIKDLITSSEFQELYPIKIKADAKSKKKWYTTEGGGVYATSTGGQVTGFGAGKVDDEEEDLSTFINNAESFGGAIIIDDPIKPEDAESDTIRERINNRFDSTIRNRVNSRNTPIIIIMQRVHVDDLVGHLKEVEPNTWDVLDLPCIKEDGEALWPFKHTIEELSRLREINPVVFDTQYLQDPKPKEGLMYSEFKTYDKLPEIRGRRENYTDVADTGNDFLCSISYEKQGDYIYILDVVYSDAKSELTEPMVIDSLNKHQIAIAHIESNSGGRMYSRNIEKGVKTAIWPFHQSKNKQARIFNTAPLVNKYILFPVNWHVLWPKFHKDVTHYRKSGKNKNDDAPDVMSGIIEKSVINEQPEQIVDDSTNAKFNKGIATGHDAAPWQSQRPHEGGKGIYS